MNYKKIIGYVAVILAVAVFLTAGIVSAQKRTAATGEGKNLICSRISELRAKTTARLGEKNTKLGERQTERNQKITDNREKRDNKLSESRTNWNERRNEFFQKLEEKAITDAQKQAVATFKSAVETAIAKRKADVNAAISAFRTDFDKLISDRKMAVDQARITLNNSISMAFDKADTDCKNGVSAVTVRENLKTSLKNAQEKFTADKKTIDKIKTGAQTLIAAKKTAFEKAISDFKNAMQTAKNMLKPFFGEQVGEQGQ